MGNFVGFGAQFNQHVYAKLSGPPPDLPGLEQKAIARPRLVRVFFNTTEWTFPDRMDSFGRTVGLANRADAQINITWQGSSYAFATANMARFADVLANVLADWGGWSFDLGDAVQRAELDAPHACAVRGRLSPARRPPPQARGARGGATSWEATCSARRAHSGSLRSTGSNTWPRGMGDLLDAWSVHVYWDFWDARKIDRRLQAEVRSIFAAIPARRRRPLFVTEFGVRGLPTFEGETTFQPGLAPDGTPMTQTNVAAFQHAWFMLRAAEPRVLRARSSGTCMPRSTTAARRITARSGRGTRAGDFARSTGCCSC